MLTNLDKKLIEKEFSTRGIENYQTIILKPNDIDDLFDRYNCIEWLECFYDSSPHECDICEKEFCKDCEIYKNWWVNDNEQRLSFNNWVDAQGPGLWGRTQEEVNQYTKEFLKDYVINKEDKLFLIESDKYIIFFFYNRTSSCGTDHLAIIRAPVISISASFLSFSQTSLTMIWSSRVPM